MTYDPTILVFIYGRGGSGKDTQAKKLIAEHFEEGWTGISTGDEIQEAKNPGHRFHDKVKPFFNRVDSGVNLDDEIVINPQNPKEGIYSDFVESAIAIDSPIIFSTGCPRTLGQLHKVDEYAERVNEKTNIITKHILLDVSDENIWKRVKNRTEQAIAEGRPPRKDDDPEVVKRRFDTFKRDMQPVLDELQRRNELIVLDGNGTEEEVNELVLAELRPHLSGIEKEQRGTERF